MQDQERVNLLIHGKDIKDMVSQFLECMRTKLLWQPPRRIPSDDDSFPLWVFWSAEHDEFQNQPFLFPNREARISSWEIKEKIQRTLKALSVAEPCVLVQFWSPITIRGQNLLTASNQPFGLTAIDERLCSFRMLCQDCEVPIDGKSDDDLGPLGRVFLRKLPEWTPNVQLYSKNEYPQLDHALSCNVRGCLALPVLEPSEQCSVGVIEVLMTSENFTYATEHREICRALEGVNLKSLNIFHHPKICNQGRRRALDEISETLRVMCSYYNLSLAQTWIPCGQSSFGVSDGSSNNGCAPFVLSYSDQVCMPTTDGAFYVLNAHLWGFWQACSEHHLQKGEGVVGKAFSSSGLCFCGDITQFSKTEYPLVHYARVFGLTSCFAICLRSTHTRDDDYIIEFFLPPSRKGNGEQETLLHRLLATMRQQFRSFRVASGEELSEELNIEVIELSVRDKTDFIRIPNVTEFPSTSEALVSGERELVQLSKEQLMVEVDRRHDVVDAKAQKLKLPVTDPQKCDMRTQSFRKSDYSITHEVLQQRFGMKLTDAAESLGISRSTLKRVCRQLGIHRWPSSERNRDNCSGSKKKYMNGTIVSDVTPMEDLRTCTIKATYLDNVIKFQLPLTSGVNDLQEQVAKRLNLKVGSFDVKYLDDDYEWVLVACDADLLDCLGSLPSSSGTAAIKMLIQCISR